MSGWWIVLGVLAVLGVSGGIGWSKLQKEHREARNLPIENINFNQLKNGVHHGAYAGGMYQWRANECDVTVANGQVTNILLTKSKNPAGKNAQPVELFDRVIKAQSLQVDTISMATLDSKAYLKAVENALLQAL